MRSAGARRRALRSLLVRGKAAEQAELAKSLAERGYVVSQSTISRDLRYLGAVKDRDGRYRLGSLNDRSDHPKDPDRRLSKAINTYAVSIEASANLVVMKTFPGAASVVASALDAALETGEIGDAWEPWPGMTLSWWWRPSPPASKSKETTGAKGNGRHRFVMTYLPSIPRCNLGLLGRVAGVDPRHGRVTLSAALMSARARKRPRPGRRRFQTGAVEAVVSDLRHEFVSEAVFPAFRAAALYEGYYLLGTSLARPIITEGMIETARRFGADAISHGATGKGNDQVRFELSTYALQPDIRIIAPWRELD